MKKQTMTGFTGGGGHPLSFYLKAFVLISLKSL